MRFRDVVSPFVAWMRAARPADTIPYPDAPSPGAPRYRGFHVNDLERCIGCGRCAEICEVLAIDMVEVEGGGPSRGDSGLRPRVDYGRCSWCALCVDVCPTGSLGMASVYSWVGEDPDSFGYVPGVDRKDWDDDPRGYRQENGVLGWAAGPRVPMPLREPGERVRDFGEVVLGYSPADAAAEAARCIECGLCVSACPAHMHVPEYLAAIAGGRDAEAVRLFYENNPFAEMCGRVCTRQCETVCAVGHQGDPLAIRWLKRYACERFESLADVLGPDASPGSPSGKRVSIVGAGPAGLTAAFYLARSGFEVHVYDRLPFPGGVAWSAIPEYRLPFRGLGRQTEVFERAGVRLHLGEEVDPEGFERLEEESDALLLAVGLQTSIDPGFEGTDLPGVSSAFALLGSRPEEGGMDPGSRVLVIGGGNVAIDAARTCRRLGAEVVISYRRRVQDMPADGEEIEEALEEAVDIRDRTIPLRLEREGGRLLYTCVEADMVPDPEGGRPRPVPREGTESTIEADTVLLAIGQAADLSLLPERVLEALHMRRRRIDVDDRGRTGLPGIYAAGDVSPGEGDAVTAVAHGIRAARGIIEDLLG